MRWVTGLCLVLGLLAWAALMLMQTSKAQFLHAGHVAQQRATVAEVALAEPKGGQ